MLISPKFSSLLARGGVYLEENDGNGNDLGAGSEAEKNAQAKAAAEKLAAEKATQEAAEAEAAKKRAAEGKGKEGDEDGGKPSDEEAKLLKEVMKRKESERLLQQQLADTQAKLKDFEGIDAAAVRKLLDEKKTAEEKQLAAAGDWERLKTRMGEEHVKELTPLKEQIATLTAELEKSRDSINEMTVGASFSGSEFINKELVLPPSKARTIFGSHFELEDGKVIGYDKPRGDAKRTALVDAYGAPVKFDDALRKIVDADSDRDNLLKSGIKPGAKSTTNPGAKVKDAPAEKTTVDKISSGLAGLGINLNGGNL